MNSFGVAIPSDAAVIIGFIVVGYFILITAFGAYFSKFSANINDFFYSGQRFSWWIPAASMVATGIGSYSYLKYSQQGYETGLSSTLTYLNDWFIVPFFMFGWLPIVYYSKVKSIPEYFERRFNKTARYIAVTIILAYMFYYIGYNLFTIGVAVEGMFGLNPTYTVPVIAIILGAYVTFGGQTAVIFTDLFQGIMLYIAGFTAIGVGLYAVGGFGDFWGFLPVEHRLPFVHLTDDPKFNTAGLFWGEALAGSIAFTFMNQGFLMRYLTIKSMNDARKANIFNLLITLPVSAIIVGAVGWIGKALIEKQLLLGGAIPGYELIEITDNFHTFIVVAWETLKHNSVLFGFIIAALTAALMSTVDTLINACAAIGIYDIYKPLIKPDADDRHYLVAARWASGISTLIGLLLVIWFAKQKGSLMSIHYKGIMVIIPAIVTTIFLGAFWKRFNGVAACTSMIVGSVVTLATVWYPDMIRPLSEFVLGPTNGQYIYFRAMFGMTASAVIGVIVTLFTEAPSKEKTEGLTASTLDVAMEVYKGAKPNHKIGEKVSGLEPVVDNSLVEKSVAMSSALAKKLKADQGDIIYLSDDRWWLGGLRSEHMTLAQIFEGADNQVKLSEASKKLAYLLEGKTVFVEKII
jgi:SSS family solute:Na+ symporter